MKRMKLLDLRTGQMECPECGFNHYANIKPNSGGKYYHGAWVCSECKKAGE